MVQAGIAQEGSTTPSGSVRVADPTRPTGLASQSYTDLCAELVHRLRATDNASKPASEAEVRVGVLLHELLTQRLDTHENRRSRRRYFDLFECYYRWIGPPRPPLQGATYVDLGCGSVNPGGLLFLFLMLGARRGIGIDLDELPDVRSATTALAEVAAMMLIDPVSVIGDHPITRAELLANLEGFDLARLRAGDPSGADTKRLSHRRESVHEMSLKDGEVDVILSNAFLEHIDRLDHAIAELARITRRGGFGIHVIDGRDHRAYSDPSIHPLDFLTLSEPTEIVHHCNRVRPMQFPERFERHGFEVLAVIPFQRVEISDSLRNRFVAPFQSLSTEELAVSIAKIVVRRR